MTLIAVKSKGRKTVVQDIYELLKESILSGVYRDGDQLRQEDLASQFQASRIPVREALLQLASEGLVEFKSYRGVTVRTLTVNEIDEIFKLRAMIEGDILRQAIPQMTEDCFQNARDALRNFEEVVASGTDIHTWASLNWDFHSCLYEPANRPIALNLSSTLHANTDRYQRQQLLLSGAVPRANQEHRKLLELCLARQVDEAVEMLQQHILGAAEQVKAFIQEHVKE